MSKVEIGLRQYMRRKGYSLSQIAFLCGGVNRQAIHQSLNYKHSKLDHSKPDTQELYLLNKWQPKAALKETS